MLATTLPTLALDPVVKSVARDQDALPVAQVPEFVHMHHLVHPSATAMEKDADFLNRQQQWFRSPFVVIACEWPDLVFSHS